MAVHPLCLLPPPPPVTQLIILGTLYRCSETSVLFALALLCPVHSLQGSIILQPVSELVYFVLSVCFYETGSLCVAPVTSVTPGDIVNLEDSEYNGCIYNHCLPIIPFASPCGIVPCGHNHQFELVAVAKAATESREAKSMDFGITQPQI